MFLAQHFDVGIDDLLAILHLVGFPVGIEFVGISLALSLGVFMLFGHGCAAPFRSPKMPGTFAWSGFVELRAESSANVKIGNQRLFLRINALEAILFQEMQAGANGIGVAGDHPHGEFVNIVKIATTPANAP